VKPAAHIGLNLVYLVPGETGGMETYARELVRALSDERPDLRLTAFVNRETAESDGYLWSGAVPAVTVPVRARRRSEWVRGEQQLLPRLAARAGVDLLHSLGNTAPAWGRFRRIVTVHDLIHRVHPEAHFGRVSLAMKWLVLLAIRRSDRLIVPSLSTRSDVIRLTGAQPETIDVVPNGVRAPSSPSVAARIDVRSRLDLGEGPIVLSASAMRPHKNLSRLLDALALIPHERRPLLVLPGYATPFEAELRHHAEELGLGEHTRFPGWISSDDLEGLFAAASAFVFPSLYEGFGLPVLEAMARGVPVACSDRGSLGEVAGDAALLFDPERPEDIAATITALLSNPAEAERLREAGRARAREFTWGATAKATLASYGRALEMS
jgi:glycosyltransferase involved in cell wall biosynthesis